MAEALAERREAYGLERISLSEEGGIAAAPSNPLRFCREVLPLLGSGRVIDETSVVPGRSVK